MNLIGYYGGNLNYYYYFCEKTCCDKSTLNRHISTIHFGKIRMSTKKNLEPANEEVNSLKRNRFNDETIVQILKRDHDEKRFNYINAIAEVF